MKKYFVPENIDLSQFTYPERTAKFLDMIVRRRFLSNLRSNRRFKKRSRHVFYSDRWVTIPSLTLKKKVHDNYLLIFEELHKKGVVERNAFSQERHEAYGYRFTKEYRDALIKPVEFRQDHDWFNRWLRTKREKERESIENMESSRKENTDGSPRGYLTALDNLNLITLKCDQEDINKIMHNIRIQERRKWRKEQQQKAAGKRLKRRKPNEHIIAAVHRCNNIIFKAHEIIEGSEERYVPFYRIDDYGRFHYYLTSLPKSLRPFVRLNGNQIASYDIKSSQCIFFALAVREESKNTVFFHHILEEIKRYSPRFFPDYENFLQREANDLRRQDHSQIPYMTLRRYRRDRLQEEIDLIFKLLSRDFYEFMMRQSGAKWESDDEFERKRKSFKEDFFEFLYGSNRRRGKIFRAFQKSFPYITLVLWKMKDLGGMYRRHVELRSGGMKSPVAWKQIKREAKMEKKWYVGLPLRMQKTEADFMFKTVAPKIERLFLPIHDCLLVEKTKRKNIPDIGVLIRREFLKLGVVVNITSEDW